MEEETAVWDDDAAEEANEGGLDTVSAALRGRGGAGIGESTASVGLNLMIG